MSDELVPSLFNLRARATLSLALMVIVNTVLELISTFGVSVSV